jgi:hypothetical protein
LEDKKKQDAKKEKMLKREQQKQQQPKPAVAATKATKPTTASNVFASLYDSDDEEPKPQPAAVPAPALKKEQFPALQQQEQQVTKPATKKPTATNAWLKSLQQSCPNLTVPKQMAKETYVNSAAVPKATLVRPKQEQEEAQACPQPILVSDFLEEEEAFAPPPREKASQLNWAMKDEDSSDDEDW